MQPTSTAFRVEPQEPIWLQTDFETCHWGSFFVDHSAHKCPAASVLLHVLITSVRLRISWLRKECEILLLGGGKKQGTKIEEIQVKRQRCSHETNCFWELQQQNRSSALCLCWDVVSSSHMLGHHYVCLEETWFPLGIQHNIGLEKKTGLNCFRSFG